jgi:glycosyltransferase involved in cell wall biosynthesis
MRIGMVLRSIDEKGGIGVYTRNITEELLAFDRENRYLLIYSSHSNLGRYAHHDHVKERIVPSLNKPTWDQIGVPLVCLKEKLDVLFHPKFTVPLLAPCKTVMVLHGAGWFMPEFQGYWSKAEVAYARTAIQAYCRRASSIISVSQLTTATFNKVFHLPPGKITTVYFAPARYFQRVTDRNVLEQVRAKYNLPEQFIFTLSGYDRGKRKNFAGILQAYMSFHGKTQHQLVVGGKDCNKFKIDYEIPDSGYGKDILFPGWIDHEDLPAVYSMADVFLYPSNVEAFPIPITEALACGTPIITSDANGLAEIVGEAALLINPKDHAAIATAISQVLSDPVLKESLSDRGIQRARMFSWDRCVRETLRILTDNE